MKKSILLLSLFTTLTAVAQTQLPKGVVYSRSGTAGEYPPAFQTKKSTSFMLPTTPSPKAPKEVKCSLDLYKRIIFATRVTAVTQTYTTGRFKVLKDFEMEVNDGKTITVKAGDKIENLSYVAEGYCDVGYNSQVYETSCIGNSNDNSVKELSKLKQSTWIELNCRGNSSGWISEDILRASPAVESIFYNPYEQN